MKPSIEAVATSSLGLTSRDICRPCGAVLSFLPTLLRVRGPGGVQMFCPSCARMIGEAAKHAK